MKLFYRESGQGEPLVILHGLYGSSDNWMSITKELEKYFRIINVDQRNHGQSPHSNDHSYASMVSDLAELLDSLSIEKANILGHSMGGKVAMMFCLTHPHRVKSQIVVDISPFNHLEGSNIVAEHGKIIDGLTAIPLENLSSRNKADEFLANWVKSPMVRQFLLKNLKREVDGTFYWKLNLKAISENLSSMMDSIVPKELFQSSFTKTLFIKGEVSNYIPDEKIPEIAKIFPNSSFVKISGTGHWVHAENSQDFTNAVLRFLKG